MSKMPNLFQFYLKNKDNVLIDNYNENKEKITDYICALLNKNGGMIFININEKDNINKIIKNIKNSVKNDLYPNVNLRINCYEFRKKTVLNIVIMDNFDVYRSKNRILIRKDEKNIRINNINDLVMIVKNKYCININEYFKCM